MMSFRPLVWLSCYPTATTSVTVLGYVTDTQLHVVESCCHGDQSCLLLLYHATSGAHSIWHVRPASTEVICWQLFCQILVFWENITFLLNIA